MEDIVAIVLLFGGGTLIMMAFSPIGRALADRIRHGVTGGRPDPGVQEELARLRDDVVELQERVDFTERMLARPDAVARLPGRGEAG
jgi:hypothetical protein